MIFRLSRVLLTVVVLLIGSLKAGRVDARPKQFAPPAAEGQAVPGEFIIKLKPDTTAEKARALASGAGGRTVKKLLNPATWLIKVQDREPDEIFQRLKADPAVVYVEPNGYVRAMFTPNDPLYRYQWNFQHLNVGRAWNLSKGAGVVVAVVDTGVAYERHYDGTQNYRRLTDLKRTAFVPGFDFVNRDIHPNDDNGHGSHVAGTIAQSTNNGRGVTGIAFRASIMPVKVLDSGGFGTFSDVADGIRWAADNGAHVINLSLGSSSPSSAMEEAVNYARYSKNVVVVAAAGNSGGGELSYPAAYDAVVSVAATEVNMALTWYSQWGRGLDLSAPGGDASVDINGDGRPDGIIQQTLAGGNTMRQGYFAYQGTSMASPHVAGVAALVRARGVTKAAGIIKALKYSARDIGPPGYDAHYGYGLVNAYGALRYRRMVVPRLIFPTEGSLLGAGSRATITWDRRGTRKLRYNLVYSPNSSAVGTLADGFESGRLGRYRTSGHAPWSVDMSDPGTRSAKSGDINDSQYSELSLIRRFVRSTNISFAYRIDSEQGYDWLDFYVDNQRMLHKSGNKGWTTVTLPVAAGQHTLRWVYSKDYSVSEGEDAAFVDNIILPDVSTAKWYTIARKTALGANSYSWTAPASPGRDYRVRMRAYNGVKYSGWRYSRGRFGVE